MTSIVQSDWFLIAITALSIMLLLLVVSAHYRIRRLRDVVDELRQIEVGAAKHRQFIQESLQGLGKQVLEQDVRILKQEQPPASQTNTSDDAQKVLAMLDDGCSVGQIARDTGLDEIEVSLLHQVYLQSRGADSSD